MTYSEKTRRAARKNAIVVVLLFVFLIGLVVAGGTQDVLSIIWSRLCHTSLQ